MRPARRRESASACRLAALGLGLVGCIAQLSSDELRYFDTRYERMPVLPTEAP